MPTWKPFYDEVARNVLKFENRQGELLALLREMQEAGLPIISLRDRDASEQDIELAEIDPFTFLANFNRDDPAARRKLWQSLHEKWTLSQPVPTELDGVPALPVEQAWFFPYASARKPDDIQSLWQLARAAVENPASIGDELFGRCLDIKSVSIQKLTAGLFWLNADHFLPNNDAMRAYLQAQGIAWDTTAIESGDISAYLALRNAVHDTLGFDHPQIAADAWKYQHDHKRPRRYWAGGHDFGKDYGGPQKDRFVQENIWQADFKDSDTKASTERLRQLFKEIQPGDELAIKGCGAMNLQVHYIGRVREVEPEGYLIHLDPLPDRPLYRGLRPTGDGAGNWTQTLLEVKRPQDIELIFGVQTLAEVEPPMDDDIRETMLPPLNKILYGPPGTGKTYTTIEEAIRIIRGDSNMPLREDGKLDHAACKREFDALRAEGRIGFATFHQSFSYEEFVEGIRPLLDDSTGSARYICRDGILKDIALRALGAALETVKTPENQRGSNTSRTPFEQAWNTFLQEIAEDPGIRLPGIKESTSYKVWAKGNSIFGRNVKNEESGDLRCSRQTAETVWNRFPDKEKINTSDVVAAAGQRHSSLAVAIINKLKQTNKNSDHPANGAKGQEAQGVFEYPLSVEEQSDRARTYLEDQASFRLRAPSSMPRFVLIIDEINRGNISKILGELITLLEDDKRLGAANSLSVTLPTSGETFALPPNLFIVGTMNTADKSLALLDIALRRRFTFQEMPPRFEVCENLTPEQRAILKHLNIRLTQSRDREHRIGHAYFTGNADFDRTFRDKIVPLLQEFFYNDWDGLRYVLGEAGSSGTFIHALADGGNGRSRTRWQWWFDVDADEFSFSEVLFKNYKLTLPGAAPEAGTDSAAVTTEGDAVDDSQRTMNELAGEEFDAASEEPEG